MPPSYALTRARTTGRPPRLGFVAPHLRPRWSSYFGRQSRSRRPFWRGRSADERSSSGGWHAGDVTDQDDELRLRLRALRVFDIDIPMFDTDHVPDDPTVLFRVWLT